MKLINDKFYETLLASSHLAEEQTRILKHGDTFVFLDRYGTARTKEEGLYHRGCQYMGLFDLQINGAKPLLLSSSVGARNLELLIHLMTTVQPGTTTSPQVGKGSVHLTRQFRLSESCLHEDVTIFNYNDEPVTLELGYVVGTQFQDIFEVRGHQRKERGEFNGLNISTRHASFSYLGRDAVERHLLVNSSHEWSHAGEENRSMFAIKVRVEDTLTLSLEYQCLVGRLPTEREHLRVAAASITDQEREREYQQFSETFAQVSSSNAHLNEWLERSYADMAMLLTKTEEGIFPHAGVPWFSAPFGRDGLITALQTRWLNPALSHDVLSFLAHHQANETVEHTFAEPGKIVHEVRNTEMANNGEVPFARFYGSVDATPLFLKLAYQYWRSTGDTKFIQSIWPSVAKAANWLSEHGDINRDGFIRYNMPADGSQTHHGWRSSEESIFHADGSLAEGPIALAEVQGYAYAAWSAASKIAGLMGEESEALAWNKKAEELRVKFHEKFWSDRLNCYALALDGNDRACQIIGSSIGHCLFTGIVPPNSAAAIVKTLMSPASYSGWGIRTIAAGQRRFNPISYHNGSIWLHDTALAARGFARYYYKEECLTLFEGLLDAAKHFSLHRVPELFCGFERRQDHGPILYPLSCAPQSWAAAAVFTLVESCLGIDIDAAKRTVVFDHPVLPASVSELTINGIRVGAGRVDFKIAQIGSDVEVIVLKREGDVKVTILK